MSMIQEPNNFKWVSKYLSNEEIANISKAVHHAEMNTGGEIVPMIVRRSSAVRHVPVILWLSFAFAFFGVEVLGVSEWYISDWLPFLDRHWGYQLLVLALLMVLAWGLSHLHWVQRLLTSNEDEKDQVLRRAQLEFFLHKLNHTHKKTAILVFISIMERRAVILADEGISKILPATTWNEVLKPLIGFLHKGEWSQGFTDAIKRCGDLLKTHIPQSGSASANEISNHLIIKE